MFFPPSVTLRRTVATGGLHPLLDTLPKNVQLNYSFRSAFLYQVIFICVQFLVSVSVFVLTVFNKEYFRSGFRCRSRK